MELSPAVIKYDASLENSSSEGFTWESHLGVDPSMESLVPGLQLSLLVKARAKNCPQSQCSISNLCTVSCTVNSTLVRNYKDTIFGFYMALLLHISEVTNLTNPPAVSEFHTHRSLSIVSECVTHMSIVRVQCVRYLL